MTEVNSEQLGLNLLSKAKIRNSWTAASCGLEGDETVMFRNGYMVMGLLDKSQCGASANGVVHATYEVRRGGWGKRCRDEPIATDTLVFFAQGLWRPVCGRLLVRAGPAVHALAQVPRRVAEH